MHDASHAVCCWVQDRNGESIDILDHGFRADRLRCHYEHLDLLLVHESDMPSWLIGTLFPRFAVR